MNENVKPGKWLYGVGISIMAAGIISFIILLVVNISGAIKSFHQVAVPGKSEIVLDKAGKYTIYYERDSIFDSKIYHSGERSISGLKCSIIEKDTNENIPLSQSWTNSNYSIGNRNGKSVFEFTIAKPGTYELSGWYDQGTGGQEVILAVGIGFANKIVATVFGGLAILFITLCSGILIITSTYLKRRRAIRELEKGSYSVKS